MDSKSIQEISEVVQSSNLNFLFGAGTSWPFLPLLGNIEEKLNDAKDEAEKELQYKEYLNKVMMPNKQAIRNELAADTNFSKTFKNYRDFFSILTETLIRRKSTILSKQANIFTSNIDVLMEMCLEKLQLGYNDGFSGKIAPLFGLANFKKSIFQRSLHFDHISEIPVINLIKIHGSLNWSIGDEPNKLLFSRDLSHIDDDLPARNGEQFFKGYRKIQVVNPEEAKHLESVLNLFYSELLRFYSSEMEKENTVLFILGFSLDDRHIREITLRAAKSNPTLRIFIGCSKPSSSKMFTKMECDKHYNIQIITPDADTDKFTLAYFTEQVLKNIILKKDSKDAEKY